MAATRLGRYTILKHLTSGGMADVVLARTDGIEGFERHVLIKRIRAEYARDRRFIDMFLDEARLAATLHHQNIVQVFDIGEVDGSYFFAMEYIHGEDLRTLMRTLAASKTKVPLGHVIGIATGAAAALHYAHERRGADNRALDIVHRDISPSNIMVGYDGAVKVLDFGIAKATQRTAATEDGGVKGKLSYMSPEQCAGEAIDRRCDVYALGVVLYELATTSRPFQIRNEYRLMEAIVRGEFPPPTSRRADLPIELEAIILRAMAHDAADRYQTADELRIALDYFAIKSKLTTSTSALAGYMHTVFGERPEPWLDVPITHVDADPLPDTAVKSLHPPPEPSGPLGSSGVDGGSEHVAVAVGAAAEGTPDRASRSPRSRLPIIAAIITPIAATTVWLATRGGEVPASGAANPPTPAIAEAQRLPALPVAPSPMATPPPPTQDDTVAAPTEQILSSAIALVASQHAAQIASCEASASQGGEITITFHIDNAGMVSFVRAFSTTGDRTFADCMEQTVRTWTFAPPRSGTARGVYRLEQR